MEKQNISPARVLSFKDLNTDFSPSTRFSNRTPLKYNKHVREAHSYERQMQLDFQNVKQKYKEKLRDQSKQLSTNQIQIKKITMRLNDMISKHQQDKRINMQLDRKITAIKQKQKESQIKHQQELIKLKEQLNTSSRTHQQQLTIIKAKVKELQNIYMNEQLLHQQQSAQLHKNIQQMQEEYIAQKKLQRKLQQQLNCKNNQIQELEKQLAKTKKQKQSLAIKDKAKVSLEMEQLQVSLSSTTKKIVKLQQNLRCKNLQYEKRIEEMQEKEQSFNVQMQNLKRQMIQLKKDKQKLKAENKQLLLTSKQYAKIQQKLLKLQEQIKRKQKQINQLDFKNQKLIDWHIKQYNNMNLKQKTLEEISLDLLSYVQSLNKQIQILKNNLEKQQTINSQYLYQNEKLKQYTTTKTKIPINDNMTITSFYEEDYNYPTKKSCLNSVKRNTTIQYQPSRNNHYITFQRQQIDSFRQKNEMQTKTSQYYSILQQHKNRYRPQQQPLKTAELSFRSSIDKQNQWQQSKSISSRIPKRQNNNQSYKMQDILYNRYKKIML